MTSTHQQHHYFEDTSSVSSSITSVNNTDMSTMKRQATVTFREHPSAFTTLPNLLEKPIKAISFNERDSIIESIEWLARHVPRCVMKDLSLDALRYQRDEETKLTMPYANTYSAALLFVDMSGFTKLSQMLDLESLSKCINSYFQKIVDEVTNHGGDILKFAGDAVFAEWRVPKDLRNKREEAYYSEECVYDAAVCGASIVAKCSDYPIYDPNNESIQIATLNVHCGLAFGEMAGVHVGNDYNRREYLILGETINSVSTACDAATYGQLVASPEANHHLVRGTSQKNFFGLSTSLKINKPVLIAFKDSQYFQIRKKQFQRMGSIQRMGSRRLVEQQTKEDYSVPFEKMNLKGLRILKKILSFYAHPVVVSDEISRNVSQRFVKVDQDVYKAAAELRSVYTIFIKAMTPSTLSKDPTTNKSVFNRLNEIMDVVTSVLDGFKGHLRQFIVDDKGVILIATFGLRGSTSPNMASERVLPASRILHHALQNELGVNNCVGTTLGEAYCGVVGGIKRHEYAVLGPPVNLAARLLGMTNHPGILINDDVRREGMRWGSFVSFPPMKAKGYSELVPVYQPLTAIEARWGKVNPMFVGRKEEIKRICSFAYRMVMKKVRARMFFVWGESGSGKSDFLVQTTSIMRRLLVVTKKKIMVKGSIGNEGDSMVPFSLLRRILSDLISESVYAENSAVPRRSLFLSIARHLQIKSSLALEQDLSISSDEESADDDENDTHPPTWESMSFSSSSSMNTIRKQSAKRLNSICAQLGGSKAMTQAIRYHLGHTQKNVAMKENIALSEIVDFMAKVFLHCTSSSDLTVVALDDLHHTDSMSWKVMQKIFEEGDNILILCGSRPTGSHAFRGDDFWDNLTSEMKQNGRFQELTIGPLSRLDLTKMASVMLDIKVEQVDRQFIKDVFDHTGGMPHYAFQAISNVKRKGMLEQLESNRFGWKSDSDKETQFVSLSELLLQRIDELDHFTRKALHMGAVLGHKFKFTELIAVSQRVLSIPARKETEHSKRMKTGLDMAVKVGILQDSPLDEVDNDFQLRHYSRRHLTRSTFRSIDIDDMEDEDDDGMDISYRFMHESWRSKILSLLLDSYKRDIHMHAANTIKSKITNLEDTDNYTTMSLFHHLKGSGNAVAAAELALELGVLFANQGLTSSSIFLYNESLDMFRKSSTEVNTLIQGFSIDSIKALKQDELLLIVNLLTALGKIYEILNENKKAQSIFKDVVDIKNKAPNKSQEGYHYLIQNLFKSH